MKTPPGKAHEYRCENILVRIGIPGELCPNLSCEHDDRRDGNEETKCPPPGESVLEWRLGRMVQIPRIAQLLTDLGRDFQDAWLQIEVADDEMKAELIRAIEQGQA